MAEENHEEWKELRARVDSLASAVFFISGGALTLSISVLLNLENEIQASLEGSVKSSWFLLFGSIICFVLLKVGIITQAFMRGTLNAESFNKYVAITNTVVWIIGLVGIIFFIVGMFFMVDVGLAVLFA